MKTSELKKGNEYYYTAGAEWVKVTYKHETINGYLFTDGNVEDVMTEHYVECYIESL